MMRCRKTLRAILFAGAIACPVSAFGAIDLADNNLIIDYFTTSPLPTIANQIKTGYDGGDWLGGGITSSAAAATANSAHKTALGYAENSQLNLARFNNEEVDSTTVLIGYTWSGDANLDGIVNALDFNALASNYGKSGIVWDQGDFNYDGTVNSSDFASLAGNFGLATAPGAAVATAVPAASIVPEPVGAILLAIGAYSVQRKRDSAIFCICKPSSLIQKS